MRKQGTEKSIKILHSIPLDFPAGHCPYDILYLWILFLSAETSIYVFTCFSKSLVQHFALLLQLRKDYYFLYGHIFMELETGNKNSSKRRVGMGGL